MLTKRDKNKIIKAFRDVDVKKISIEHGDLDKSKWFKFGSYVGLDIATKIIEHMPEKEVSRKSKVS